MPVVTVNLGFAVAGLGGWAGPSELHALHGEAIPVEVNITPLSHFTESGRGYIVSLTDLREQFGGYIPKAVTRWVEPAWRRARAMSTWGEAL